ncbi:MAG: ester cyclase [Mycobacterium sp.]|uniref:ester cyclase n=1 Tax=Mycobacterium sp. TaxID=1785 RepID=UPI003F9D2C56
MGPGYVWIDHVTGLTARSEAELHEAQEDASAYSSARYDIEQAFEATNGAIIIQGRHTCTLAGPWRGMEATGRTVSFPFCAIFRFDDDGLIVQEEQYYDMHSVRRELGY